MTGPTQAPEFSTVVSVADPTPPGRGKALRFRVRDDAGRRSSTWRVQVHANTPDVYVGMRSLMGVLKLSLHYPSGLRRLANTGRGEGAFTTPFSDDRVWERWDPPTELSAGWTLSAAVSILNDGLVHRDDVEPSNVIQVAAGPWGWTTVFYVFLSTPDAPDIGLGLREVGRLRRADGGIVWVGEQHETISPEQGQKYDEKRATLMRQADHEGLELDGFMWHTETSNPWLVDMGLIRPGASLPPHINLPPGVTLPSGFTMPPG